MKIKTLTAALFLTTILASCMKDDDFEPQPVAGLNVIHASPGAELLDFYIDNKKANSTNFSFGNQVGYLNLFPGNRQISIAKKGVDTALLSQKFDLDGNFGYSIFIANKPDAIEYLFLKDDLTLPETGKARIRFVNLSPDAPALSLAIAGKENDVVTNKIFKEYSTFVSIDAAEKLTFNVKNTTEGGIEASIADIKIEAGRIYTIWVKGLKSATDNTKIGLAIFQHK